PDGRPAWTGGGPRVGGADLVCLPAAPASGPGGRWPGGRGGGGVDQGVDGVGEAGGGGEHGGALGVAGGEPGAEGVAGGGVVAAGAGEGVDVVGAVEGVVQGGRVPGAVGLGVAAAVEQVEHGPDRAAGRVGGAHVVADEDAGADLEPVVHGGGGPAGDHLAGGGQVEAEVPLGFARAGVGPAHDHGAGHLAGDQVRVA